MGCWDDIPYAVDVGDQGCCKKVPAMRYQTRDVFRMCKDNTPFSPLRIERFYKEAGLSRTSNKTEHQLKSGGQVNFYPLVI